MLSAEWQQQSHDGGNRRPPPPAAVFMVYRWYFKGNKVKEQ